MLEYIVRYAGRRINDTDTMAFYDDQLELEAGTFGTYTFTLPPTHPHAHKGAFRTKDAAFEVTVAERYSDGEEAELFRGWVTKTSVDTDLMLKVECEGQLSYLQNTVVRPYSCRASSDLPDGCELINEDPFEYLIAQHNAHATGSMQFEVGYNPHAGSVPAGTDWKSTWDELNDKFCANLDRYLNARTGDHGQRMLDLLDGGAGEGTQAIVLGENVVTMDLSGEDGEKVTAIIPRATSDDTYNEERGQRIDRRSFGVEEAQTGPIVGDATTVTVEGDRVVNWDMVRVYGYREEKRDYDANSPENLALMAAADLNPSNLDAKTVNSVEVTAIDLHAANPSIQPIRLLDWTHVFVRAEGLDPATPTEPAGRLIIDQWLPCSKLSLSTVHPEDARYRFGDLPQTLTRRSALRLGMLRRGNGTLVRRTDAMPWDNDRTWNRAQEVEDGYIAGDDDVKEYVDEQSRQWGEHLKNLDGGEYEWYNALKDADKKNAQGREELGKELDALAGVYDPETGTFSGPSVMSDLQEQDTKLMNGIADVARNAQRTFFGECSDRSSSRTVPSSALTQPGGETFELQKGVVVDVLMDYSWEGPATLSIGGTQALDIYTNGSNHGVWQDGQVVRFLYDGSVWQACSTDLYGNSITVGNPSQANFRSDGRAIDLNIGNESFFHVDATGQRVGLEDDAHITTRDDQITFYGPREILSINTEGGASIKAPSSLTVSGYNGSHFLLISGAGAYLASGDAMFGVYGNRYFTNNDAWCARSFTVTGNGGQYLTLTASQLGIGSTGGYAFAVTNGDMGANNFFVVGTQVDGNQSLQVKFDRDVTGRMRLNVLGVPVGRLSTLQDPENPEGPEIFDDPTEAEDAAER